MDYNKLEELLKEKRQLEELKKDVSNSFLTDTGYQIYQYHREIFKQFPDVIDSKIKEIISPIINEEIKNCEEYIKKLCHEQ